MSFQPATPKQSEYVKEWNTYAWSTTLLLFTFFLTNPITVITFAIGAIAIFALQHAMRPTAPSRSNLYLWGTAGLLIPLYSFGGQSILVLLPLLGVIIVGTILAFVDDPLSDW